jgi:hypothetical protein
MRLALPPALIVRLETETCYLALPPTLIFRLETETCGLALLLALIFRLEAETSCCTACLSHSQRFARPLEVTYNAGGSCKILEVGPLEHLEEIDHVSGGKRSCNPSRKELFLDRSGTGQEQKPGDMMGAWSQVGHAGGRVQETLLFYKKGPDSQNETKGNKPHTSMSQVEIQQSYHTRV